MMPPPSLLSHVAGDVLTLTLNRPQARNALDAALIEELTHAFESVPATVRTVVLRGAGQSFCAGADLGWMGAASKDAGATGARGAQNLQRLFAAIAQAPQVVVAVAHGPVRGGGGGLLCAADVVLAGQSLTVAFPEATLGLIPAIIAPYVVARIGIGRARYLFLTSQVVKAEAACAMGLAHELVADEDLEDGLAQTLARLHRNGPHAQSATKALLQTLAHTPPEDQGALCARALDAVRAHPEAQEGCAAFLARRAPSWRGG
jgi:enoyl-CoA hydratase/carnithine racemase